MKLSDIIKVIYVFQTLDFIYELFIYIYNNKINK